MKLPLKPHEKEVFVPFETKDEFKAVPGTRYLGLGGLWARPVDMEEYPEPDLTYPPGMPSLEKAKLAQIETVRRALADGVGYLARAETGLGKTYIGFQLAQQLQASQVLVICPSQVKYHWEEVAKVFGYQPIIWEAGKDAPASLDWSHQCHIINYEILTKLPTELQFHVIIADEAHLIKNSGKGIRSAMPVRTRAMFDLRDRNPSAFRLALSATPLANSPIDGFCLLEWLWPGRFGSFDKEGNSNPRSGYWKYAHRYHEVLKKKIVDRNGNEVEVNEVGPPRADRQAELVNRLRWCSMAVLKRDILIPGPPPVVVRNVLPSTYISDLLAAGTPPGHILVFCYNRENVEQLAEQFPEAVSFHGGMPAKRRHGLIEQANAENRMVIATMDSAGLGIDNLASRSTAVYTQMAWKWVTLRQAMGRNERLSSTLPPQNHFLVNNPYEERKIRLFCRKLAEIESVMPTGTELASQLGKQYGEADFEQDLEKFLTTGFGDMVWMDGDA